MDENGEISLDEIMSEPVDAGTAPAAQPEASQPRDENGRFAGKEAEPQAQAQPQQPQAVEAQPQPQAQPSPTVPLDALHASREETRQLRQQLQQALTALAATRQPAAPQQPAQPQPKKEIWDDPDAFLSEKLTPIEQMVRRQTENFSRMIAVRDHGQETVQTAYQAMAQAMQSGDQNAAFEYRRIMASEHPYDALVIWHKTQSTLAKIGNDPDAWVQQQLDAMLSDPAKQAEILQRIQGSAATAAPKSGAPIVNLPPSLNRIGGGANNAADNDTSDEALFRHAMG